jgi:DNA-binding NarL/FixJ family response regulator
MVRFRILLADDHPIVRFGLCSLLSSHEEWEICGEACDGQEAVEKCRMIKPDLLILDICLPRMNGGDAAREILKDNPAQRILVLTNVDSEQVICDCLQAGVRGWIFKSDGIDDLVAAIAALQQGRCMFSASVSNLIMDGYLRGQRIAPTANEARRLTSRERQIVQLVSEGKASKEIATLLGVAVKTAETHRSNILRKLRLHSTAELVLYAVRNEIVHVQLPAVANTRQPGNGHARVRSHRLTEDFLTSMPRDGDGAIRLSPSTP